MAAAVEVAVTKTTTPMTLAEQVCNQQTRLSPRKHDAIKNSHAHVIQLPPKNGDGLHTCCRLWKQIRNQTEKHFNFPAQRNDFPDFLSQTANRRQQSDQINCSTACTPFAAEACPLRLDASTLVPVTTSSSVLCSTNQSSSSCLSSSSQSSHFSSDFADAQQQPVDTVLCSSSTINTPHSSPSVFCSSPCSSFAVSSLFLPTSSPLPRTSSNQIDHIWSFILCSLVVILRLFAWLCYDSLSSFTFAPSKPAFTSMSSQNFIKLGRRSSSSSTHSSPKSFTNSSYRPWILLSLAFQLFAVGSLLSTCEAVQSETNHPADLCYLSEGGSSQTFIVNEATPPNSLIGTLQVIFLFNY